MKAVILESYVMEEGDLDWSGVKALVPDTTSYVRTDYADIAPRIGDAELVLINKCRIDEAVLAQCPNLKWVGIIATGTDNIDLEACRRHGVAVANVPGYSTYSVAQMTFSLLLAICQCAQRYDRAVKAGYWQLGIPAEYGLLPQVELLGKTFGIYGYGSIGRQTARIARAFGMEVLVCTRTVRPEYAADGVEFVDFDTLLARSDVLSLHCPATPENPRAGQPGSPCKNEARRYFAEHCPGRTGGRGGRSRCAGKRQACLLRCRCFCHRAAAAPKPVAQSAGRGAHPAYRMDHQGSIAAADGYHHRQPAQLSGRERREYRQPLILAGHCTILFHDFRLSRQRNCRKNNVCTRASGSFAAALREVKMSYAIVFSSKTGNTALLAQTLQEQLPQADCCYFGAPDAAALAADTLYVGFWTDKGKADADTLDFLQQLHGKRVFLFGTAGFGGSAPYFEKILAATRKALDGSNTVIGSFMCQGKMPVSVRQRYEAMKAKPLHIPNLDALIENFDKALSHPDAADLEQLKQAVK